MESEGDVRGVERVSEPAVDDLREFLHRADLTVAGLDEPTVQLWIQRDGDGGIIGSTGFELSTDGRHALVRSVAVAPEHRAAGTGSRLARFAIEQARGAGAGRAWLFSRRSGPFWQKLGFTSADRHELAAALPAAHQVRLFVDSGQLEREVAWSRVL
ncbi:GNAT family N-acetyltransferase [Cellulomonas sp.]|uniref:GNAT family N-acetyltransferase n=1 Tax=Cellulomonas sp. TaxID=40001 RepID=UPI0025C254C4|nr:GNAT family N-acetyltransferase [Cellulomonas sp.]